MNLNRMKTALVALPLMALAPSAITQDLRVGAATNVVGMVVFVAQDKGFFAKNGVDAKVVTRNTGPALTKSLRAGEIDFAPAAFTNLPAALERGLDLRGVVGYVGSSYSKSTSGQMIGIAARPGTGIKKIADLKGRKVGVAFGGTGDLDMRTLLKRNGSNINDVNRSNGRAPSVGRSFDAGGRGGGVGGEYRDGIIRRRVEGFQDVLAGTLHQTGRGLRPWVGRVRIAEDPVPQHVHVVAYL